MPREFIARNGVISLGNIVVSGSITTTGTVAISGSIASASFATSASFAATASSADNLLVRNTLTAQTLVVQTITSSVDFVTGSTRFGTIAANTHVFTGSMAVSGSITSQGGFILGNSATIAPTGSIGYNNAVGVFIYGKSGSEADFRLYNRDGLTAMSVNAGTQNVSFNGNITASVLSRIGDVFIGGRSGTYASYTDGIFGDNLHLGATGATGGVFINAALSRACIINPVGGNVAIGTNSANTNSALTLNQSTNFTFLSLYNASSNANSRNWTIGINTYAFGDFGINQSNALNGDPTAGTSRLYISNTGQVAIGTQNPSGNGTQRFLVTTSAAAEIARFTDGTNADIVFDTPTEAVTRITAQYGAGGNLVFARGTGRLESKRITTAGKLCVGNITGTIFGSSAHRINGAVNDGGQAVLEVSNSGTTDGSPTINCYKANATTTSDARFIQFYSGAGTTAMGGIVGNGTSNVQFASISDIREKENIETITNSLSKILALNPVQFDWKKTNEHVNAGFVAQQVEEIFPEYVVSNMSNEGEEERKGLTGGLSSGIIAHLVKAIQELTARVQELENK
jgi:hypothetical protein